jgi:hypothetical protein
LIKRAYRFGRQISKNKQAIRTGSRRSVCVCVFWPDSIHEVARQVFRSHTTSWTTQQACGWLKMVMLRLKLTVKKEKSVFSCSWFWSRKSNEMFWIVLLSFSWFCYSCPWNVDNWEHVLVIMSLKWWPLKYGKDLHRIPRG